MKTRFLTQSLVLAALLLLPAWAGAADLNVTNGAAFEGNFGMQLVFDGDTTQTFVQDNTPDSEPTYNFEFRLRFNDIVAPDNATQQLMQLRSDVPSNRFRVFVWCAAGPNVGDCGPAGTGSHYLAFQARRDSGEPGSPYVHCAHVSAGPNGYVLWRVEFVNGSGSNDGTCRVFRNGTMIVERFDMPDEVDIDAHRWGALAAVNPAFIGELHGDNFVSTR